MKQAHITETVTAEHHVLTAIFPREQRLVGCPLIILLLLFLDCASFGDRPNFHVVLNTIPPGLFRASSLSNSFNFPRYATFDPVIIVFSFNMSKPSQPTLFDHKTDLLC